MKRLLKLALLVGAVGVVVKIIGTQKNEFQGLTESEARAKLDSRIPDRVPAARKAAVIDRAVSAMRERGVLREDEAPAPTPTETDSAPPEPIAGGDADGSPSPDTPAGDGHEPT